MWTSTIGEGVKAHVDAFGQEGGGPKSQFLCGRHKWMTPMNTLLECFECIVDALD